MAAAKTQEPATPHVFTAIASVMADLAEIGISKDQQNRDQGFAYRGIDDIYNVLSKLLSKNKLVIVPQAKTREVVVNKTRNGSNFYFVTLHVDYTIASAVDGSSITASAFGEASDMGDKATNKAMSTAYKYLCFQLFCIPVDVPDADATTPPETYNERSLPPKSQGSQPQDNPPQNNAPKDSGSQSSGKPKSDPNVVHALTDAAHEADTDEELKAVALDLHTANKQQKLTAAVAKELAMTITAKRSGIVKVAEMDSLRKMVKTFHDAGMLTPAECDVAITTAESRLNIGE